MAKGGTHSLGIMSIDKLTKKLTEEARLAAVRANCHGWSAHIQGQVERKRKPGLHPFGSFLRSGLHKSLEHYYFLWYYFGEGC